MHTLKLSNYASNAAAVEAAILLSARDAGARVVLDTESILGNRSAEWSALMDLLLAGSDLNAPELVSSENEWLDNGVRFHGHTPAGHPWEVVLL